MSDAASFEPEVPDFLIVLGLRQPVTVEDVKQAYLDKAKTAHPDRGGNVQQFIRLQQAFEQATEYARFKAGRMKWLSGWVEQYAEQQELIEQLKALGGSVETESVDWMARTVGSDFATVLDRIVTLRLNGPRVDNATLMKLLEQRRILSALRTLELKDTKITSEGLAMLHNFESLHAIDLSGTKVDPDSVELLLASIKGVQSLTLRDCGFGRFAQIRFRLSHRDIQVVF